VKTILVVEDTEDDVFFLLRALKAADIPNPVQIAIDGQQALDYLSGTGVYADRKTYPLPFLVLLDLKLPYVMGLDVLKWIRARREFDGMIVAVLTSSQQDRDITETTRLGGNFYFVKPPSKQKLAELMRNLAEQFS
jgi:DNA-binding response OmpR family regulator